MKISGASGPSTAPKLSVARAARTAPAARSAAGCPPPSDPRRACGRSSPAGSGSSSATIRPARIEQARKRPPEWLVAEAELPRQRLVEVCLEFADQLQEEERDDRDRRPDDRREDEEAGVGLAPQQLQRRRRRSGRPNRESRREARSLVGEGARARRVMGRGRLFARAAPAAAPGRRRGCPPCRGRSRPYDERSAARSSRFAGNV